MTPEQFRAIAPLLIGWIKQTLTDHAGVARSVASFGFLRLSRYFSSELLTSAKVVVVDRVPTPPLSALGATGFEDFENMDAAGITYLDTYFVQKGEAGKESLHFHELIHIVQWRLLGSDGFLAAYADGLARFGYRNSPFEVMAYDMQDRFDTSPMPFNAEQEVADALRASRQRDPTS